MLELGARYGTVSCVINNKLADKTKQVSVEPDSSVWNALESNLKNNGCESVIIHKGIVSPNNYKLLWNEYSSTVERSDSGDIISTTIEDLEINNKLKFDTLVADCEGCLESFFSENPKMYEQLKLIIMEEDQINKCNYDAIKEKLHNSGFKLIENNLNEVWRSVWQK